MGEVGMSWSLDELIIDLELAGQLNIIKEPVL